jgi:glycosyltransferase involved in cell wall biosynthesis
MQQPSLSVFVPAYNAAHSIRDVIGRIPEDAWQIIEAVHVIDDDSTDDTERITKRLEHEYPKVHLYSQQPNQGYGEAVRQGMARCLSSACDYVACLHADGQYPPEQLLEFVQHMHSNGIDVLQGSRHKAGAALSGGMPVYKYVAGKCLT